MDPILEAAGRIVSREQQVSEYYRSQGFWPDLEQIRWLREAALQFLKCDYNELHDAEDSWWEQIKVHKAKQREIARYIPVLTEWLGPWAVKCRYRYLKSIGKDSDAAMLYKEQNDADIRSARETPLYEYLGVERGKRIPCPFHSGEKNNFSVREVGYCFTCGFSTDAIGYAMKINGLKFGQAVAEVVGKRA